MFKIDTKRSYPTNHSMISHAYTHKHQNTHTHPTKVKKIPLQTFSPYTILKPKNLTFSKTFHNERRTLLESQM